MWLISYVPFLEYYKNYKNYNITKEIELYNNINKATKRKCINKCNNNSNNNNKKKVTFLNVIKISYIQNYDDEDEGWDGEELWWSQLDNINARSYMNSEINFMLQLFPKMNRKQAMRLLYQPSNTCFQ